MEDEALITKLDGIDRRLDETQQAVRSMETRHAELATTGMEWREAIIRLDEGFKAFAKMQELHSKAIEALLARMEHVEIESAERAGRDGVWAALARSPIVGWIAAVGAGIAAFMAWIKPGV